MINKRKLAEELTEVFIMYQHRLDFPMPSPAETKEVILLRYSNEPLFHARVDALVAGVLNIVMRHQDDEAMEGQ